MALAFATGADGLGIEIVTDALLAEGLEGASGAGTLLELGS